MIFLVLAGAAIFVGFWRGGFSSLAFPDMNGTVGFCPGDGFRSCSSFIYLLLNLHALEHLSCFPVGLTLKVPALYIGLLCPAVRNGAEENLIYFFGEHLLGGT